MKRVRRSASVIAPKTAPPLALFVSEPFLAEADNRHLLMASDIFGRGEWPR